MNDDRSILLRVRLLVRLLVHCRSILLLVTLLVSLRIHLRVCLRVCWLVYLIKAVFSSNCLSLTDLLLIRSSSSPLADEPDDTNND